MIRERARQMMLVLLMIAAIVFPFSVAATNVALGGTLGVGVLSGAWWEGVVSMWRRYRWFCVAAVAYWGLMILGLIWSSDRAWGMHVLGRQWYWLLVPLVMLLLANETWRPRFLGLLSLSLAAHLLFCVLQIFGYVTGTTAGGSTINDATGHIGHIGFGVVYGMWTGFLLQWGQRHTGWYRIMAWLLAGWAVVMVFLAQGRSGYLVVLVMLSVLFWKKMVVGRDWRVAAMVAGLLLLVGALVIGLGPAKKRILDTERSAEMAMQGDVHHAEYRWSLWLAAWYAWREHPLLGIGTGGFPQASVWAKKHHPELDYGSPVAAHPHNMYLLALARCGVPGLVALLVFFGIWIRMGWCEEWERSDAGALIALSGIALAVHGLSAPSLEEHFEDILAVLLLGTGLSYRQKRVA